MNPLDRIHQLTDENAILRTQLCDARGQAKRDSETIARQRERSDDAFKALEFIYHQRMTRAEHIELAGKVLLKHPITTRALKCTQ